MGLVAFAIDADPSEFERVMKEMVAALWEYSKEEMVRLFLSSLGLDQGVVTRVAQRARALS